MDSTLFDIPLFPRLQSLGAPRAATPEPSKSEQLPEPTITLASQIASFVQEKTERPARPKIVTPTPLALRCTDLDSPSTSLSSCSILNTPATAFALSLSPLSSAFDVSPPLSAPLTAFTNMALQTPCSVSSFQYPLDSNLLSPFSNSFAFSPFSNLSTFGFEDLSPTSGKPKKIFTCPVDECGIQFPRIQELKAHMTAHDSGKDFLCTICGSKYRRAPDLKRHYSSMHVQTKPFVCPQMCGKSFARKDALKRHMNCKSNEKCAGFRGKKKFQQAELSLLI